MATRLSTGLALVTALICAAPAHAQSIRPPSSIEIFAGHAGFADDATIEHSVFGGAGRIYLTPRISVGPEITYMRGPGEDRDWFFLGNFIYDFRRPQSGRPPLVSPFVIAGGGFFTHSDSVGTGIYTSGEGAVRGRGRHACPHQRSPVCDGGRAIRLGMALPNHRRHRRDDVVPALSPRREACALRSWFDGPGAAGVQYLDHHRQQRDERRCRWRRARSCP